jgi:hypothetical protein
MPSKGRVIHPQAPRDALGLRHSSCETHRNPCQRPPTRDKPASCAHGAVHGQPRDTRNVPIRYRLAGSHIDRILEQITKFR